MTYPVKYYHDGQTGAPTLSGTAGTLIALLDACLIDGFNLNSIDSVVRNGQIATATISAGHGYVEDDIVLHSGWTQTEYNGEVKIFNVTTNTYDFTVVGTPVTPAPGVGQAKIAPVGGWAKVFSATNKAVYQSTDPQSTQSYLRVDESGVNEYNALVRGYESMSDIDTGTGPYPTVSQSSFGLNWRKSNLSGSTPRRWLVVADAMMVYLLVEWSPTYPNTFAAYVFGDIISYKAGDAYNSMIHGHYVENPAYPGHANDFVELGQSGGCYLARSYTQIGSAISANKEGSSLSYRMGYNGIPYPSPVDNSLILHSPVLVMEGTTNVRGILPGLMQPVQVAPLAHLDVVDNVSGLPGGLVLLSAAAWSSYVARVAFDITGPWR